MLKPLVIGLGNRYRGDDAAGLEVASRLEKEMSQYADFTLCQESPLKLLDLWKDRETVFLIDALSSGEKEIGYVHYFLPLEEKIPAVFSRASSHLVDIVEVIELAKALGELPKKLVLYGIESYHFSIETEISPELTNQLTTISQTIEENIMHEMGLFKDIMNKIASLSKENEGKKIVKMKVVLGAQSHLSASHFQSHFDSFSKGTAAEGAELDIIEDKDENAPHAQGVILESVEMEI